MPSVSAIRAAGLLLLIGAFAANVGSHAQSQPSSQAQGQPSLIFSTTLGGLQCDCNNPRTFAQNTGSDAEENTYVTGATRVTDLPVLHAFQPKPAPGASMTAFVAKLDRSGQLLWLTYLGGNQQTMGEGLAVLPDGGVAVDGITSSDDSGPFPTLNGFQDTFAGGGADYFLSVFDKHGNMRYSTYFGGEGTEGSGFVDNNSNGNNLAADAHGLVYLVGTTKSADLPVTPNALQAVLKGDGDAIVVIFNPSKSGTDSLIYSSFLGGHQNEKGHGAAVGATGELITAIGYTDSDDFPTTDNAYRKLAPPNVWVSNGFVTQFTSSKPGDPSSEYNYRYSTYLGSDSDQAREDAYGVAIEQNGIIAVTGRTVSPDFPTSWPSIYPSAPYLGVDKSNDQPYMVKIDPSQEKDASLVYGTYLGGGAPKDVAFQGGGFGTSIGVDLQGNLYLAGETSSYGVEYQDIDGTANLVAPIKYPYTWNALIPAFQGGSQDAMFMQIPPSGAWLAYSTYLGGSGDDRAYGLAVDPDGNVVVDQIRYFIVTPDKFMNKSVREAFAGLSVEDENIFTESIPANMNLGLGEAADDFVTLIRYAQPDDGGGDGTPSDKWRKDLPLVVLRVRDTHHVPQPYIEPAAVALERRTAFNEYTLQPDLIHLVSAVHQRWTGQPCKNAKCSDVAKPFVDF